MPDKHAELSPSSAERWLSCPASVRLTRDIEGDGGSAYATEGTLAHTLGELKARESFGHKVSDQEWKDFRSDLAEQGYSDETVQDMHRHTDAYVEFIRESAPQGSAVLFEQRVDTGVPECWGTSDVVIVSQGAIEIIDLKYGAGVPVSAVRNAQLRLYGIGSLETFGNLVGDTETVTMTIFQPRLDSVSRETMSAAELIRWRDEVALPAAREALYEPYAKMGPSDKGCRWCPIAGSCTERTRWATLRDFGDILGADGDLEVSNPVLFTPEQMSNAFRRTERVKAWAKDVEAAALDMAYNRQVKLPGLKVVRSGGRRVVADPTAAIQRLIDAGYPAEKVADFKIKGFGDLDKALGKGVFEEVASDLIHKTPGREALVPESDKRPTLDPTASARDDFNNE